MYFNRTHERDGHLVQGRFRSTPVRTLSYLHMLVGYIDWNPIDARLVDEPAEYPYGSAWHFARLKGPPWLARAWIEDATCHLGRVERYSPASYRATLGARPTRGRLRIVLPRLNSPPGPDHLDDLLGASSARLRAWFQRRATAADGTTLGPPLVDELSIEAAVHSVSMPGWKVSPHGHARDARRILHAALLRSLARLTAASIGRRLSLPTSRITDALSAHRELIQKDPLYLAVLARATREAIRRCHGKGFRQPRVGA
jgi:hypothetical protein